MYCDYPLIFHDRGFIYWYYISTPYMDPMGLLLHITLVGSYLDFFGRWRGVNPMLQQLLIRPCRCGPALWIAFVALPFKLCTSVSHVGGAG